MENTKKWITGLALVSLAYGVYLYRREGFKQATIDIRTNLKPHTSDFLSSDMYQAPYHSLTKFLYTANDDRLYDRVLEDTNKLYKYWRGEHLYKCGT